MLLFSNIIFPIFKTTVNFSNPITIFDPRILLKLFCIIHICDGETGSMDFAISMIFNPYSNVVR